MSNKIRDVYPTEGEKTFVIILLVIFFLDAAARVLL